MNLSGAVKTFKKLDRLDNNPDLPRIEKAICEACEKGTLDLVVFVCPKFNTAALLSDQSEKYMPIDANDPDDLFFQRIPKIKQLLADLITLGIDPKLNLLIGDNDAEVYIFPYIKTLSLNFAVFNQRRNAYLGSFTQRATNLFKDNVRVESLGLNKVIPSKLRPNVQDTDLEREIRFFSWLFGETGPYKGKLSFDEKTLREMAVRKFALYGAQGTYLEKTRKGGVLLQTEGPGVWLLRTQMLRCTGSGGIPAIYPWIRKEES